MMMSFGKKLASTFFLFIWISHTGLCYSSISDWGTDWALLSGRVYQPKCIDIPSNLTLCQGVGYHKMRLPNLLDHDTIKEVTHQAKSWVSLLGVRCHPDTQLLLCSLFSPVCLDRLIWPCRSLCEAVKAGCAEIMQNYRFPWPEMLRCDKFPEDNDLCIPPQNTPEEENICTPCKEPDTYEGIIDNYCRSEFVVRAKIKETAPDDNGLVVTTLRKKKFYKKSDNLEKKDLRNFSLKVGTDKGCQCGRIQKGQNHIIMGSKHGDDLVATYIIGWPNKRANPQLAKIIRRAIRKVKKDNICKGGIEALDVAIDGMQEEGADVKTRKKRKRAHRKTKSEKNSKTRKGKGKKGPKADRA